MIGYHANGDYWLVGLMKGRISPRLWHLNSYLLRCNSNTSETSQKPGVNYPARSLAQQFATGVHPIPIGLQSCLVKQDDLLHLRNSFLCVNGSSTRAPVLRKL